MIQAVIARLGSNGFFIKGWAVTLFGAFIGFAISNENWELAMASVVPTLAFWSLDALFLRSERLFRELFDFVSTGSPGLPPFFMAATAPAFGAVLATRGKSHLASWPRTAFRPTLVLFYGGLIAAALTTAALICNG